MRRIKITVAAIGTGLLVSLGPQVAVATLPLLPALAVAAASFGLGLIVLRKTLAFERSPVPTPETFAQAYERRSGRPGSEAPSDGE